MKTPSYLPIDSFKGYSEENKEWVYGWHWTDVPYTCFDEGQKIRHYIRVQKNYDWNLTEQIDYEVKPESVAKYIGKTDINRKPLFLGDSISFDFLGNTYVGQIQFDINTLSYIVSWDKFNKTEIYKVDNIKFVGDKYRLNKEIDDGIVYTVALFFKEDKKNLTLEDILSGIACYKEFFGNYPKTMHLTETQHKSFIENTKELYIDIIEAINEKYGCKIIAKGTEDEQ